MRALYDVAAPAKLNLFLHVVGRRADGYHLLQSVFVLIDWCDTLHFEIRDDGCLARHDLGLPLPADDLCLRAARRLQAHSGTALGADISVAKQVPWGAGMGGGSSDAASTLLALNRLWRLGWSRSQLAALGASLGADVPFFVGGRNAFVEGIGERLAPIEIAPEWFAVVKPATNIETAAIFASPALVRETEAVIVEGLSRSVSGARLTRHELLSAGFGRNDLQPVAEAQCPEITLAASWLHSRHHNSRMTGSGSSVFARLGPAEGEPPALAPLPPGWAGRMCKSLDAHPLVGWAGP